VQFAPASLLQILAIGVLEALHGSHSLLTVESGLETRQSAGGIFSAGGRWSEAGNKE
jgi:hypothetical protein